MARNDESNVQSYLEGVPVKISEKYKPPKRITMPSCCSHYKINHEKDLLDSLHYDFQLEKTVSEKMAELKEARRMQKEERNNRIKIYMNQKEKSKELLKKEGRLQEECSSSPAKVNMEDAALGSNGRSILQSKLFNNPSWSPSLMQNSQFPHYLASSDVLKPVPISQPESSAKSEKINPQKSTFNLSDFETEATPFDSVELKTLNDYEELAQVLQLNACNKLNNSTTNNTLSDLPTFNSPNPNGLNHPISVHNQVSFTNTFTSPNALNNPNSLNSFTSNSIPIANPISAVNNPSNVSNPYQWQTVMAMPNYTYDNQLLANNNRFTSDSTSIPKITPINGISNYLKNIDFSSSYSDSITNPSSYASVKSGIGDSYFNSSSTTTNSTYPLGFNTQAYNQFGTNPLPSELKSPFKTNQSNANTLKPSFFNSPINTNVLKTSLFGNQSQASSLKSSFLTNENNEFTNLPTNQTITFEEAKTRSRSVPDIMNSLQKELNSIKLNKLNETEENRRTKVVSRSEKKQEDEEILEDSFQILSEPLKVLAKQVSGMGFPLQRVARVCKLIGDDEDKVVVHMIVLSELLDFGFSESAVSEALLKFDNNRDQALEYLIS